MEEDYTSDDTPTSTIRGRKRKGSKNDQDNKLDVLKTRSLSHINRVTTAKSQGPPPLNQKMI